MQHLPDPRVHGDQPIVKLPMLPGQHVRIPRHAHEQRLDATAQRRQENLTDLQANEEGEGHDDAREFAAGVVGRVREFEVEEGEQAAEECHEGGTHGEHGADQTVIDEGVDAPAVQEGEGVLGGGNVGLAEEGDVDEGIAVDESVKLRRLDDSNAEGQEKLESAGTSIRGHLLDKPIDNTDDTSQNAIRYASAQISLLSFLRLSDAHSLPDHVDQRHNQRSKTDTAK